MDSELIVELKVRILELLKDYYGNPHDLMEAAFHLYKQLRLP